MTARLSKILLVVAIAVWLTLVAFGNITDYGSNLVFVQHVLAMDTIFPNARIHYRAVHAPVLQHMAYLLIISAEALASVFCWTGVCRMWLVRRAPTSVFQRAKRSAVFGLSLAVMLWLGGFMAIGGEWFGMWMSAQWNGLASAFRFVTVSLLALIYLGQRDDEIGD